MFLAVTITNKSKMSHDDIAHVLGLKQTLTQITNFKKLLSSYRSDCQSLTRMNLPNRTVVSNKYNVQQHVLITKYQTLQTDNSSVFHCIQYTNKQERELSVLFSALCMVHTYKLSQQYMYTTQQNDYTLCVQRAIYRPRATTLTMSIIYQQSVYTAQTPHI